jgi:hypothetical protein
LESNNSKRQNKMPKDGAPPLPTKQTTSGPQKMILRRKLKVKERSEGSSLPDDDFNKGPWLSMLQHLSLPPFVGKSDPL